MKKMNILWVEDDKSNVIEGLEQICNALGLTDFLDENHDDRYGNPESFLKELRIKESVDITWIGLYHKASKCIHEDYSDDKWDIAILDLNLQRNFEQYKGSDTGQAETVEKEKAGFTIYLRLLQKAFPHENICFFTGNKHLVDPGGSASKEIENLYEIQARYGIPSLEAFNKSSDGDKFENWLKSKNNDKKISLRRGIINACQYLTEWIESSNFSSEKIRVNNINNKEEIISKEEIKEWLETLPNLINITHDHWQKSFVFLLLIHWDARLKDSYYINSSDPKKEEKNFYNSVFDILRTARNWSAHNRLDLTQSNSESIIAFIFILCMRSVFEIEPKIQSYEKILLKALLKSSSKQSVALSEDFLHKKYEDLFRKAFDLLNEIKSGKNNSMPEIEKIKIYKYLDQKTRIDSILGGKKFYSYKDRKLFLKSVDLVNIINNIQDDTLCEELLAYSLLIDAAGNFKISKDFIGECPKIRWYLENIPQNEDHWFSHLRKHIID